MLFASYSLLPHDVEFSHSLTPALSHSDGYFASFSL